MEILIIAIFIGLLPAAIAKSKGYPPIDTILVTTREKADAI